MRSGAEVEIKEREGRNELERNWYREKSEWRGRKRRRDAAR